MKTQIVSKRFTTYNILYSIVLLIVLTSTVSAQGNSPIKVSITPQAELAVAGEYFHYTIVVENTSSAPARETIVSVSVPDSAFYGSYTAPAGWYVSNPPRAEKGGIVTFYKPEAMSPNEEETLELMVEVANELDDPQIMNEAFVVLGEENLFNTTGDKEAEAEVEVITPTPGNTPIKDPLILNETRIAELTVVAVNEGTRIANLPPTATPDPVDEPAIVAEEAQSETVWSCLPGMVFISLFFSMMVVTRSNRPMKL